MVYISYNTGTRALPDIYVCTHPRALRALGHRAYIRYRFNATSHSLASVRIPLASNSHSIEYMYYWARTRSRARARKKMVRAVLKIYKMILMALSYIAVLVTRKCTHAAWHFKIEIVTSNSALISFHQHCSRISCCSLVIFFLFIGLS